MLVFHSPYLYCLSIFFIVQCQNMKRFYCIFFMPAMLGLLFSCIGHGCAEENTQPDVFQPDLAPGDGQDVEVSDMSDGGEAVPCGESGVCEAGLECCDGECVSTRTDLDHCGGCNMACPPLGNMCISGNCSCNSAAKCDPPLHCCPRGCTDVSASNENCGSCGNACLPSETCQGGVCIESPCDPPCETGESCCSGECIDTQYDRSNCGDAASSARRTRTARRASARSPSARLPAARALPAAGADAST